MMPQRVMGGLDYERGDSFFMNKLLKGEICLMCFSGGHLLRKDCSGQNIGDKLKQILSVGEN